MLACARTLLPQALNKFRDLGYIKDNDGNIEVHSGLLSVLLNDTPHIRRDDETFGRLNRPSSDQTQVSCSS